jgi:hypothetical protein
MKIHALIAVAATALIAGAAGAETMRATTTFNTGIQEMAAEQPADGVAVEFPVVYDGALDGCTAQIAERLFPRDEGAWGIFEVAGDVTCGDGGFAFTTAGSWDEKGFHSAGHVSEGSGTGRFSDLAGRIAQSGGFEPAADGNTEISYVLMIDAAAN